ncbi:recombinase family protein [Microbacterium sp. NPDC077663]|uniref:recombinase family protein n=1 Tax=Microbacterium sp. NPDC077663 TaxID=3364189 RepID=UPI0037C50DCB
MNIVGYARVSTRDQNPAAQEAELRAAGAGRVFVDHGESSRVSDRPQWIACLDYLRPGDTLVVRALDRVAGSEVMAIELIRDLARRGIRLRSLTEPFLDVDTSTPMGEAIVGIMAVLAQLRVSTIRDNTRRGLEHARTQGRVGGRPSVMTDERTAAAVQMRGNGDSVAKIGRTLGVGASSVARALDRYYREQLQQTTTNESETTR